MTIYLTAAVCLLILILPTTSNLIEHAGSIILTVITLLGVYAWVTRKTRPAFDRAEKSVMWAFAVYFLVCFLFLLAYGLFDKGHSLHWNLDHEIRLLAFIPIYFLFYRTGLKPWALWYGTASAGIISGIYAVIYIYGLSAGQRATGAYHPIAFGDLSLVLGFMSLAGFRYFQKHHTALTAIPILAVSGGILASFLSGTRGAIIAIPFLTLIFFIQLGTFRRPWRDRSILVLTVLSLSFAYYHLPGICLDHRIRAGITEARGFFQGKGIGLYSVRLGMWSEGWKMFTDHPVRGLGKNGYKITIQQKIKQKQAPKAIAGFGTPHNMYLTNMTAYGIFGLLILLAVFLVPLGILIPAAKDKGWSRDTAFTGIMLIAAFMMFAITESIFYRNVYSSIYVILLAAVISLTRQYKDESLQPGYKP